MRLKNKINWLNVIINNEFQNYLDEKSISEISKSSRSIREKLNPLIFKKLKISKSSLNHDYNNIVVSYYKFPNMKRSDIANFDGPNHGINLILEDFSTSLSSIKKFVKSLHFCDFNWPGVYIFPIIDIFNNLVNLELGCDVMIPYSRFAKLGESMPSLIYVKVFAILVKLSTEYFSPEDYVFPPNLKYLEIINNNVISTNSMSNPYKLLFYNDRSDLSIDLFKIPKISMPSLNELIYFDSMRPDLGLKDFLEVNPNLESLTIRSSNLNSISTLKSLKNLKIDGEISFNSSDQFPALKFLQNLHIFSDFENDWEDIKKLCYMCKNLVRIDFNTLYSTIDSQQLIDSKLAPIVSNFSDLKAVKLDIDVDGDKCLNLSKFSNIETLILKSQGIAILNLKFINCKNLRKVILESTNYVINTKVFRDKFNSYNNWMFKFSKLTIKGYKINQ